MRFYKHMLLGWLITVVPFLLAFFISAFTRWDIFDAYGDIALYGVPLFGLVWIIYYFRKYTVRDSAPANLP